MATLIVTKLLHLIPKPLPTVGMKIVLTGPVSLVVNAPPYVDLTKKGKTTDLSEIVRKRKLVRQGDYGRKRVKPTLIGRKVYSQELNTTESLSEDELPEEDLAVLKAVIDGEEKCTKKAL